MTSVEDRSSLGIARRLNVDRGSRVPLSTQIGRQITWLVATGSIEEGELLPAIGDLAQQIGVNVHTVRAAYGQLRDDGIVRMQRGSRTRVLGYNRGQAWARSDRHSSFTIGVLVPSFTSYYTDFLEAVADAAGVEGWLPIICQTQGFNVPVVSRYMDQLFSRNVDGVIAIHVEMRDDSEGSDIFESSEALPPFVYVDSAEIGTGSRICVDRVADGFTATNHLIGHGHQRVAYMGGPEWWTTTRRLGEGYANALSAASLEWTDSLVVHATDHSLGAGAQAASELLAQDEPPTAIFCAGDILALGAISAMHDMGLQVPGNMAVMGYGAVPLTALTAPPLSTICLPAIDLGHEAVRALQRAIDRGSLQAPVAVETTLILRESCGCLPTPLEQQIDRDVDRRSAQERKRP